ESIARCAGRAGSAPPECDCGEARRRSHGSVARCTAYRALKWRRLATMCTGASPLRPEQLVAVLALLARCRRLGASAAVGAAFTRTVRGVARGTEGARYATPTGRHAAGRGERTTLRIGNRHRGQ